MTTLHHQTRSYLDLLPQPEKPNSKPLLALWMERYLAALGGQFQFTRLQTDLGRWATVATAERHAVAERSGNSFQLELLAEFMVGDKSLVVPLGSIPYPDANGEFVLNGRRLSVPVLLRPTRTPPERGCSKSKTTRLAPAARMVQRLLRIPANGKRPWEELPIREFAQWETWLRDPTVGPSVPFAPPAGDPWRDPRSLAVILLGDVLQYEWLPGLARALEQASRVASSNAGSEGSWALQLVSLLSNVLEAPTHRLFREYARPVEGNPIARLSAQRAATFFLPGGVHPESAGNLTLRDVDGIHDQNRLCPVETPQGQPVGLMLQLARHARIDPTTRRILPPAEPSNGDVLGPAASLLPFIDHDDGPRALMAANMLKQALRPEAAEVPWVRTGWEEELRAAGAVPDEWQQNGVLTIGINLRAAYLPWGLLTYEDGIVVSETAAGKLAAVEEETFWLNEGLAWFERTVANPACGYRRVRLISPLPVVGATVNPGEVLLAAVERWDTDTDGKKLDCHTAIGDPEWAEGGTSETLETELPVRFSGHFPGVVIAIEDSAAQPSAFLLPPGVTRRIGVRVRWTVPLHLGDKLAGRHGNKGVVTAIVSDDRMPFEQLADGTRRPVEIILNPLGVLGRKNVGQLYETAVGAIAEARGTPEVVPPFSSESSGKWTASRLADELRNAGLPSDGKVQLFHDEAGEPVALDRSSLVGPQYVLRLHHLANEKRKARGGGDRCDYSVPDDQPTGGPNGGQRVGEMEAWALAGHEAWDVLGELFGPHSDDRVVRAEGSRSRRPRAFVHFVLVLRCLGIDPRLLRGKEDVTDQLLSTTEGAEYDRVTFGLATEERTTAWMANRVWDDPGNPATGDQLTAIRLAGTVPNPLVAERFRAAWRHRPTPPPLPLDWRVWLAEALAQPVGEPLAPFGSGEELEVPAACRNLIESERSSAGGPSSTPAVLTCLLVLPSEYRPEETPGQPSGLTRLYAEVRTANRRLIRALEMKLEPKVVRKCRQQLAKRVAAVTYGGSDRSGRYHTGLLDRLGGKTGLLRGRLAGKRVDHSARAVIVGDPTVGLDEVRLPVRMWRTLFGTDTARRLVLLNRQPSLHRYSIQAFWATPDGGKADVIRLCPFVCAGFGADFDGDTMAVYAPRSTVALADAERLLPSRQLRSQASGGLVPGFGGDMALAACYLTAGHAGNDESVPPPKEAPIGNWWKSVTVGGLDTTPGRQRFAQLFVDLPTTGGARSVAVPNRPMDKSQWGKLVGQVADLGPVAMVEFARRVAELFDRVLLLSGLSVSIADVQAGDAEFLRLAQLAGAKGDPEPIRNPSKRELTGPTGARATTTGFVKTCLLNGHTPADFLLTFHDARRGLIDKGLTTAPAGALARRLVYLAHRWLITQPDCGTSAGIPLPPDRHARIDAIRARGRSVQVVHDEVRVRSPITCADAASHGCCAACYGVNPATGEPPEPGLPIGVLAAQAVGERATQLTLKTFHGARAGDVVNIANLRRELLGKVRRKAEPTNYEALTKLRVFFAGEMKEGVPVPPVWEEDDGKPRHVHFEVLLAARQAERDRGRRKTDPMDAVSRLAFGYLGRRLLDAAAGQWSDDLRGAVSRIITLMRSAAESPAGRNARGNTRTRTEDRECTGEADRGRPVPQSGDGNG